MSETSIGHSSLPSAGVSAVDSLTSVGGGGNMALSQSLVNYYDPSLISHISGWPAEQIELRVRPVFFCTEHGNYGFYCVMWDGNVFFGHR